MANHSTDTSVTESDRSESPRVLYLALDAAARGQQTAVAVLQDARIELRTAVDSTIDLAEQFASGAVRFARKLAQKVDEAAADALKGTERALSETIEKTRETAKAGRQLAERAVEKVRATAQA